MAVVKQHEKIFETIHRLKDKGSKTAVFFCEPEHVVPGVIEDKANMPLDGSPIMVICSTDISAASVGSVRKECAVCHDWIWISTRSQEMMAVNPTALACCINCSCKVIEERERQEEAGCQN